MGSGASKKGARITAQDGTTESNSSNGAAKRKISKEDLEQQVHDIAAETNSDEGNNDNSIDSIDSVNSKGSQPDTSGKSKSRSSVSDAHDAEAKAKTVNDPQAQHPTSSDIDASSKQKDEADAAHKEEPTQKRKSKRKSALRSVIVGSQDKPDQDHAEGSGTDNSDKNASDHTPRASSTSPSPQQDQGNDGTGDANNGDNDDADGDDDSDTELSGSALDQSSTIFREFAAVIFRRANVRGNGRIDMNEFDTVLRSPTLNLNISEGDAIDMFYKYNHNNDGGLTFAEFQPLLKELMCLAYQQIGDGSESWVRIGFSGDEDDALPLFFNRESGKMSYTTPSTYIELEDDSAQNFEYFVNEADGSILTTYMDGGQRLFLDLEKQTWEPLPTDFDSEQLRPLGESFTGGFSDLYGYGDQSSFHHQASLYDEHTGSTGNQYNNQRQNTMSGLAFNTVANPVTGENVFTCMNKEERSVRLYADPVTSQLKPLPLEWEAELPEVAPLMDELSEVFPNWTNQKEKLLALRLNDYDVAQTREWKAAEVAVSGPDMGSGDGGDGNDTMFDSVYVKTLKEGHDTALAQVGELKNKVIELETTLESTNDEKATLERDLAHSRKLVERQQTRIFNLEEQAEAQQSQPTTSGVSKDEADAYEAKIRSLELQVVALHEGSSQELNKALADKDEELLRLQRTVKELNSQLANASKGHSHKWGKMQYELQELKQQNISLRTEFTESVNAMKKIVPRLISFNGRAQDRLQFAIREEDAMRQRYQRECLKRKLLYNKLQELRGNIRVFCRCRFDDRVPCVIKFISENELLVPTPKGDKVFEFDQAYDPSTTQEKVYEDTSPIITSCVDGYNVCFLAYGQTGSGKTFTMMGPPNNPGVNRRAIKELFEICEKAKDIDYSMEISLMEIYNENVFDLLAGDQKPLKIRMAGSSGGGSKHTSNYVENLTIRQVKEMKDVTEVLEEGDKNRSVASTAMNIHSSRSHLLLQLTVSGVNRVTGVTSKGKLTLCDLAGSERVGKSKATGARLVEAAAINKSLTSLGLVFSALAAKQPHVPYRNSKLTHVLADSLGGDAKTCVFINISPAESNVTETLSTLTFGQNIAKIEMGHVKKNVTRT